VASDQLSVVIRVAGIALVIFALLLVCYGQKVIEPWEIPCGKEIVQPNLVLKVTTHIYGELRDSSRAALEKSKVRLRKQTKMGRFVEYRTATTDGQGRFDFKSVEAGSYRFLPGPNRGWKQPKEVSCWESSDCEINLTVELNPTDMPFAQCPIK